MLIKQFKEISKTEVSIAGGKGASLGEMTRAGIPVLSGFVILAAAFERFLREAKIHSQIDAVLHKVDPQAMHTVEQASEEIKALIMNAEMPKDIAKEILLAFQKLNILFVAVRSSATAEDSSIAAWAGQLESYLNTTKEGLLENVKKCWASLFTPRAIFYRFEQNLHEQHISVAVVVQKMVESEVSGIAFSVHPVTQDYNQLIIEAGFGLGEAIVSGQITPDSYVVEKKRWDIIEKNVSTQTKALYRSQKGGNEWKEILGNKQKLSDTKIIELAKLIVKIERHYGFPVDVEWAYEKGKFYIVQSRPITTLQKKESIKKKENSTPDRIISKLKSFTWKHWLERPYPPFMPSLCWIGVNQETFAQVGLPEFGFRANLYQYPHAYYAEELVEENYEKLRSFLQKNSVGTFTAFLDKVHRQNLSKLTALQKSNHHHQELVRELRSMAVQYFPFLWITLSLERYFQELSTQEVPKYYSGDTTKFIGDISIPTKKNYYVKMQEKLRLGVSPKKVLQEYGWMKSRDGFTDFYTLQEIEEIKKNLTAEHKFSVKIPKPLQKLASDLQELTFFRTHRTDCFYEFLGVARPLMQRIAKEMNISLQELGDYHAVSIIDDNPQQIPSPYSYVMIDNEEHIAAGKILETNQHAGQDVRGTSAYKGKVTGIVKVVKHPMEVAKVQQGDILVTPMTHPDYIPTMRRAAAIVTDEGGSLCHAAIIARELKKPCIIGTKIATQVLKDGDLVEVDANKGIVKIIKK